ncbi:hypothetical protein V6N13_031271 [Hibiscus sabdariffa]
MPHLGNPHTSGSMKNQETILGLASDEQIAMITTTDSVSLDHSRHGSSKASGLHPNLAPSGSNGQVTTAQAHQPRVRRI